MERNMAMHKPNAWIIEWEGDGKVTASVNSLGVASDWLSEVVCDTLSTAGTCADDEEVVAVKMDRMWL
jgi:hypothetical protein